MAAITALPHSPRPIRAAASIVAVPVLLAAVLALHAIGPNSEPRVAETLPPPGQGSHIASLPSLPGTVSAATLTPRATGLLAADLFQAANTATRLSILSKVQPTASPAPPAGPTLDQIERAQAGVAEAQLALQALQQGATDAQIQQAQSQVQQAQNQLAGAHASVTPLPTATPAPTVAPTTAPTAAPVRAAAVPPVASATAASAPAAVAVATPQPLPYSDTQLTQAAAALNAAQQSLAQAQQYNASLAVPAAAPLPGASRAGAVPVPGSRIATPAPATPAPAPVDLTPYQAAVDDAQNTFNTMTTADQAIDQQNADLAASLAAAPAAAPDTSNTGTDSAAAPDDSSNDAAVVAATAPAAPVVSAASTAADSAPPQPSATPLPAATATSASSPTDSNGTDSDTTATNAQSQLSGALSQLQALQSPPPAEAVKAAQDSLTQAQQQLDTLLKQASPDVAAQVDPDPMTVLQKLRAGTLALDQQISNGFIWPAKGPVTQGFGLTAFALDGAYNGGGHTGVDIGQGAGQPIVAAAAGTVIFSGGDTTSGYGDYVELDNGNGYQTIYGHMMTPSFLKQGDHVAQGQLIGISGSTGYSTGPHVHFEVRLNGVPIDPLPLLGGLLPKPLHP